MRHDCITLAEIGGGVIRLAMDDATTRNRLSAELCTALRHALMRVAADESAKAVLWTGRRDVFCAGATKQSLQAIVSGEVDLGELDLPAQIVGFPIPIVAALEGHAVGGGLILALCCDVVIAAERCRYGLNFTTLGFTPGMGTTTLLPALIGHHRASEMILTGKFFKGRELLERGLFNQVVPTDKVYPTALDTVRRMAEKPRHVLQLVKETMAVQRLHLLQAGLSREKLMHLICLSRPETRDVLDREYLD